LSIANCYEAALGVDMSGGLKVMDSMSHTGPPDAEHQRDRLVRERECVDACPIVIHQQLAGEPLLDSGARGCASRQADLYRLSLNVAKKVCTQAYAGSDAFLECTDIRKQTLAPDLNKAISLRYEVCDHAEPDHTLASNDTNLDWFTKIAGFEA
jgi:hypothetical protein